LKFWSKGRRLGRHFIIHNDAVVLGWWLPMLYSEAVAGATLQMIVCRLAACCR